MLAITLPADIEGRLTNIAAKKGRTAIYYARKVIREYIEDMEDYELGMRVLENPGRIYTMEEVEAGIDLED